MNILYAMGNNYAGLACHYLEWINTHTQHSARAFLRRQDRTKAAAATATGSWYDAATMPLVNGDELADALAWADVVHCLHGESPHTIDAAGLLRRKRFFFGLIGMVCSREHMAAMFPDGLPTDGSVRFTHDDHGHDQYEPFVTYARKVTITRIPWLVDITHERFTPLPFAEREARVGMYVHLKARPNLPNGFGDAYTAGQPRKWADKGAAQVGATLAGLPFHRNEVEMSWLDVLAERRRCQLGIDEMISPCWNLAGIEFLALGVPCLNDVNEWTVRTMREVTGAPSPWIVCDWKTLRERVEWYFGLPAEQREYMCAEVRAWALRYYHPEIVWQLYEDLYNGRATS